MTTDPVLSALRDAIKKCSLCNGAGEWESHCYFCEDSTHDHHCNPARHQCDQCAPWRKALAEAGSAASEVNTSNNVLSEAGQRGERCPVCRELDHEHPCL